jgi:GAF domain-containing protein/HAMP domain-containing protein
MRSFLGLRLSSKLFFSIAFAVAIPMLVLLLTSFLSVQEVSGRNLEDFLTESGEGRSERISSEINASLSALNAFVNDNESDLVIALAARASVEIGSNNEAVRRAENNIKTNFRAMLANSESFNSLSMMNLNNITFASEIAEGEIPVSFGTSASSNEWTEIKTITGRMGLTDPQELIVIQIDPTESNENWHIIVLNAIYGVDDSDNRIVVGFVLADLNYDALIIENLEGETTAYDTYAYMLMPPTDWVIRSEANSSLVDIESDGAERAIAQISGVLTYNVFEGVAQRRVRGYTTFIRIDNEVFGSIVVEANEAVVGGQIIDEGVNRIFPFTVGALVFSLLTYIILNNNIVPPTRRLRDAMLAMIGGDFEAPIKDSNRADELGLLATSFVDLREHIRELTDDMNRRLRERTRDVQVTQDIGRAVTAERDLERLMNRVVALIVQNFPSIYHAQIFLLDEDKQYAILRASTGQAGRELLSRGHKLGVGSVSVIGQVTEQAQVIIARDTAESSVHRQNEFLGETRAELAIPLRLGNEVIGALDVQSKQRDSFDEDQVAALQTLADQITIAIENARLYAESARLLGSIESERGSATRTAWQQYMYQERKDSIVVHSGVKTDYEFEKLSQAVLRTGKALVGDSTSRNTIPFAVPIVLRGQTLGVVEYEVPQGEFNYDKVLLAEELVARLAISMENARLFQSSQQSAERERIVNTISTKLTGQTDIEEILQTAIREVGQALRTPQIAIRLTTQEPNGKHDEEASQENL